MSKDSIIKPSKSPVNILSDEGAVATISKDAAKAMFYIFAGKPDSKVKMFNRRVIEAISKMPQ